MFSGKGRASNRLVVGTDTDAGGGGRMPHSRFWLGVSMRVRLFAALGLAVALLATLAPLQVLPLQAQTITEVEVTSDWSLKPAGLGAGDKFRLLFLSSTKRNGMSTDIADYNTFIQNLAAAGHTDIRAYSAGFRVVGCTADVDARDNTGTTGTGVPIYWLNGSKVADHNTDFYDQTWDDEANDKNASGNDGPDTSGAFNYPLTGCNHNGTRSTVGSNSNALGATQGRVGRPNSSSFNTGPLSSNGTSPSNSARPMYGLSQVFVVGSPPSTDATLSDLALEDASNGSVITLSPGFSAGHLDYSASVGFPVSQITVIPTKNDAGASIRYLNDIDEELGVGDRFQLFLAEGAEHLIKVEVTAEDGIAEETYTLTVTRAGRPGEVLLSEKVLSLTEGSGASSSYLVRLNRRPAASVTVTIGGHVGTNVTPSQTSLTFTTSNWSQAQRVYVSTGSDANTTNESVRLTHEATSPDSLFDGITVPSVVVNVDDDHAPDYHIRTIRVPHGSHALEPGDKPLPEEEFTVDTGLPFGEIEGVAEGHIWRPSGLWGDPGEDTIWVVDPSHFGIHALKLSALKEGLIERRVAADTSGLEQRLNYQCHFKQGLASGNGNPSLTVMWGTSSDLWVANDSSGTIDAYSRSYSLSRGCYTKNVTSWATDLQSYETADEHFQSPFDFVGRIDVSRGPRTIRGIWAISGRVWFSGPSSGLSAGGVYAFNLGPNYSVAEAPGYDGHEDGHGLWSDGTTMWVATDSGWLRAYDLNSGVRSAEFDIRIRTYGMPPGDIWSDGETIWVTNRGGKIDAYHLPGSPGASLRATEADALTASFALAPETHDGENGFKLRIDFSDDVEITPEDMRDHALLVSGGTVTGAARVKDRSDLWELTVEPAGPGPVSILAPLGRACTDPGALCTADGRSLTAGPALVVPGPPADNPPGVPDQPEGTAVFIGGVDLEWDDVPGADSYDVQLGRGGLWIDLPGGGVEVAFYGAGAIISGLDPEATLWFQVRAANAHGVSDWSATLAMSSTSQFKNGRKARPDNAPASGAPVVHGTAQAGESLWADASGIEDGNGLNRVQFRYQWTSNDGSTDTDIAGATDSGYTLAAADVGKTVKVKVAFTDRRGYSETRTSAATDAVEAAPRPDSPATGQPTISGTAQVGETLTVGTSGIADADGLTKATYSYQWMAGWTDIPGATRASYTLTADDEGLTIQVWVGFIDDAGYQEALTSAATNAVEAAAQPDSPATGQPTITGTVQVGETLTAVTTGIADADGLVKATYSYQWVANDGTTDTDISGATDATYTLAADDAGRTIKVRVIVTDDLGNETTLTSTATDEVGFAVQQQTTNTPATGEPTIIGTAQVGETLTAETSGIVDADGLSNATYTYQWVANDGTSDTDISGATDATYTLVADDEGRTIKVRVIVTDDAVNETTLTSAATEAVEAAPEPPAKPTGLSANVVSHDAVTLAWDDPQDSSITGYVILRRDREIHPVGTFVTVAGDSGSADTTYTDATVEPEKQYNYKIRAINEHGEVSEKSHWVLAVTPAVPVPDTPTGLSASVVSHDAVTLAWDDPEDDSITGYVILRRDWAIHPAGTFITLTNDTGSADTTYTDETVEPEKRYNYKIKAIDEHGEQSEKSRWVRVNTPAAPQADSPATGAPTITGTAQVGETLTAETSDITDDDGLTTSTFSYQWVANDGTTDTDISGATDATYTLAADDAGKTIKVRVIVTDDLGNETTLTSTATDEVGFAVQQQTANTPATGEPTIIGTAQVGETLTADTSGIADADGLTNVSYSYQWIRNDGSTDTDITSATDSTYTLVDDDQGKTIKVRVIVTDDAVNETTLTSAATEAVEAAPQPDSPATGQPTIIGTARVGQTLTADTSGIADADGLATYTYQWVANDGTTDTDISGATDATYTLVDDDEGRTIKVRVIVTDDAVNETTLTSAATEAVEAAPQADSPATGQPTIIGTAQVGQTLTADTSGIADADGLATYTYQWVANDGTTDTDISGATDATYTLVDDDEGRTIKVRVIVTDDLGNETTLTSAATEAVEAAPQADSPATGQPTITGTAQVGQTLTADTSGIADADGLATYTYQWVANDGTTDTDISGATDATYILVDDDEGRTIKVRVIVTDDLGNETTLTSAATEAVEAAPQPDSPATGQPTITGTAQVGQTLTADTSGIADADGLATYTYQWVANDGTTDTDISGATDATYTLVADDAGRTIKVRVTVTDDLGNETTLTSAATEAVEAAPQPDSPATGEPTITGTAQVGRTLTADTTGIGDSDGLTNVSYRYQWVVTDGGAYIDISGETGATYTLVAADRGLYIQVRVSFKDDAGNRETLTSALTEVVAAAP